MKKEEKRFQRLPNIVLIDYIKSMCDLLSSHVKQSKSKGGIKSDEVPKSYETLIQEYEA